MVLNANDHIAFDAIIDFAPGQTFGSFSYPDATTNNKGIVQIDSVGGIAVNFGVISLASSGVTPTKGEEVPMRCSLHPPGRASASKVLVQE